MPRPLLATIYPEHIAHNLSAIRQLNPNSKLWAVIKANAYGHGIERVFPGLQSADGLAMLQISEAQCVRSLGWRKPILMIEGAFALRDLEDYSRLHCWHVVHCHEQIDMLAAHKTTQPHRVFIKLNSGMNRLGFAAEQFASAYARLMALPQVQEVSMMTHFASADEANREAITPQLNTFLSTCNDLDGEISLSNSAAALRHQLGSQAPTSNEWIRAGIAMYGGSPNYPHHTAADWNLQPAMTLSAQIIGVQSLKAGDSVGYGATFTAKDDMRIGIVACGYADGYPRHAQTGSPVLVGGESSHTLGRVSMDMIAVDLTHLPHAGMGSEVTLWGRAANGAILDADAVAHHAGTISYELFCALAARVTTQVA